MAHASAWDRIRGFGLTSARMLLPGRGADPLSRAPCRLNALATPPSPPYSVAFSLSNVVDSAQPGSSPVRDAKLLQPWPTLRGCRSLARLGHTIALPIR